MKITFLYMDIFAYSDNCELTLIYTWGSVTSREFVELDGLTRHCGSISKPWSIVSNSNIMNVRFISRTTAGRAGFLAIWTATNEPPTYPPSASTGCSSCSFPFTYADTLFDTCTSINGDQPSCFPGPPVDEGLHDIPTFYYCSDSDSTCPSSSPLTLITSPDYPASYPINAEQVK